MKTSHGQKIVALLPIDAQPTRTRQAYGMDKVWQDEFECLFSHFISSNVAWTLVEVETNPSFKDSDKIIAYSGRYIVRCENVNPPARNGKDICCAGCEFSSSNDKGEGTNFLVNEQKIDMNIEEVEEFANSPDDGLDETEEHLEAGKVVESCESEDSGEAELKSVENELDDDDDDKNTASEQVMLKDEIRLQGEKKLQKLGDGLNDDELLEVATNDSETMQQHSAESGSAEIESDCDSGAQVNSNGLCSTSSGSSTSGSHSDEPVTSTATETNSETSRSLSTLAQRQTAAIQKEATIDASRPVGGQPARGGHRREFLRRFRMFIDSAKVRFCCDNCGHGWTSMKGRVVFWYELFEIVDLPLCYLDPAIEGSGCRLIGYCAYKLFGQQCDVCKIENRFQRPMWYPEEVTKVLNNLYNKIGQIYFGFKMPAIDKQRRAGKPKTSHNSSLCQACHDGVCTDRK